MLEEEIKHWMGGVVVERGEGYLLARSFHARLEEAEGVDATKVRLRCSWLVEDAPLAERCLGILQRVSVLQG